MPNHYHLERYARISATFTSTGGAFHEPTGVNIFVQHENSTVLTTITRASTLMKNPSTGRFYYDHLITSTGAYEYRVQSTGSLVVAGQGIFYGIRPLANR